MPHSTVTKDKINILGSQISIWNLPETVDKIADLARDGGKHYVCISNVHTVVMGVDDPKYAAVTNEAALATADGVPLIWASKLLHKQQPSEPEIHGRASGPDIMPTLFASPRGKGLRHYFYGSTPEVLRDLESSLRKRFPDLVAAGYYSPPFRKALTVDTPLTSDELADCRAIDESNADIVWVGLGAPKQEIWMYRARKALKAPLLVGVGAAFDFLAGNKKRAPKWMQKTGLEWSYRLAQEPKRLATRYLHTNPIFVAAIAKELMLGKLKRP